MERFIRLNRSILDCDLAKGGWRLDEEGIAAIEDEVAELVRIIAQSHRGDIPRESAAFAEFRRTCLAVMVRLKEVLPDEYDLLEQTERAEIRFFWMLRRHRLTVIFLAKLETHFPTASPAPSAPPSPTARARRRCVWPRHDLPVCRLCVRFVR